MGRLGRTAKAFKGANTPGRNDESWLLKEPRFSALPSHASFFFSSFTFLDAPACRRGDDRLRGSASSRQEARVLRSPIIRPWARAAAQRPVPGFLPSRAPSSGVHRIVTERSVYCVPGTLPTFVTKQTWSCPQGSYSLGRETSLKK